MARVSNPDLRKLLDEVARTTGFTVEYRRARAKVTNPDGAIEFIKIGSSGFYARDVERQLRHLGWPPPKLVEPKPPAPELRLPDVRSYPPVGAALQHRSESIKPLEEPMATLKPAPTTPPPTGSLRERAADAAWRYLKARPGHLFTLDEVIPLIGLSEFAGPSVASAIGTEYRLAGPGHPWLHIHRTHTRPQRYYYHETEREPWVPKALRGQPQAPLPLGAPGPEVLAELPDGDLLLRTPDGKIWRAVPLGDPPRRHLEVEG